jgi:Holliday junction resolvase RusA-like endonuclease
MHEVTSIKATDGSRKAHPVAAFKATCRLAAQMAYSGPPLDCPLSVRLVFVMPRPSALQWKTRPMPRLPHAKKPDVDNLTKSVLDALTGLLWLDDAQIAACSIEKWIAAGDEQPHVEVEVSK